MFSKGSDEVYSCNLTQKYSSLGSLNDNFKYKGYFEFLLEYPEKNYYVQWRQKKNPMKTKNYESIVKIHVPENEAKFSGLALSTESDSTFIDGSSD